MSAHEYMGLFLVIPIFIATSSFMVYSYSPYFLLFYSHSTFPFTFNLPWFAQSVSHSSVSPFSPFLHYNPSFPISSIKCSSIYISPSPFPFSWFPIIKSFNKWLWERTPHFSNPCFAEDLENFNLSTTGFWCCYWIKLLSSHGTVGAFHML